MHYREQLNIQNQEDYKTERKVTSINHIPYSKSNPLTPQEKEQTIS